MDLLRLTKRAVVVFASALTMLWPAQAAVDTAQEYAVKSAFLYNFIRFIDWPRSAFASPDEPLIIGIVGEDRFDGALEEAVRGETFRGRPIVIERYRAPSEIKRCHLLFVSDSETGRLSEIINAVSGSSVVTVGETNNFISYGGMITLASDGGRVRLLVNPGAMQAAKLEVSSKLLRVAEIVQR